MMTSCRVGGGGGGGVVDSSDIVSVHTSGRGGVVVVVVISNIIRMRFVSLIERCVLARDVHLLARDRVESRVAVLLNAKTETTWVNAPVCRDQGDRKARLGEDVEDTVEDRLAVGRDDVATFRDAPADRVAEPDDKGDDTAEDERAMDVLPEDLGVFAGRESQFPHDVEHGGTSKGVEAPFIAGFDQGTDQAGHDHDFVQQADPEDGGPGHASGQQQIHEQHWRGDEPLWAEIVSQDAMDGVLGCVFMDLPIDVSGVKDLSVDPADNGVTAKELDIDGRPSQIGAHCEIGDAGNHTQATGEVEEHSICARLHSAQSKDSEASEAHHGADSEVPIRSAHCLVDGGRLVVLGHGVDAQGVIAPYQVRRHRADMLLYCVRT